MSATKNYYWDEIEEYEDESMEIYGTCLKQYTDALEQDVARLVHIFAYRAFMRVGEAPIALDQELAFRCIKDAKALVDYCKHEHYNKVGEILQLHLYRLITVLRDGDLQAMSYSDLHDLIGTVIDMMGDCKGFAEEAEWDLSDRHLEREYGELPF